MRVVFDTNIYISAFAFPGGRAEEAFLLVLDGRITLCSSTAILAETAEILRKKFGWEPDPISDLLKYIGQVARVEKIPHKLSVVADAPDNRILECAEEAEAAYIVTGDRHLLDLKEFGTCSNSTELACVPNSVTRIVTLAAFLSLIGRE